MFLLICFPRSVHVQRIFKFIENLKKQETEILNIISDMREVQKAINTESEKADRCFLVASQLLKDVRKLVLISPI